MFLSPDAFTFSAATTKTSLIFSTAIKFTFGNLSAVPTIKSPLPQPISILTGLPFEKKLLKPHGKVLFKTDNRGLFDFSLPEFEETGFELSELTYDLHSSEYAENNVMTEYERRFSSLGTPINRVVATKKD